MLIRTIFRVAGMGLLLFGAVTASMQSLICDAAAAAVMTAAQAACPEVAPDQACYGHPQVAAELTDLALSFAHPGDTVPLSSITSISTTAYNEATGDWGIVHLRTIEIDGVSVELIVFGAATVTHDGDQLAITIDGISPCAGAPNEIIARAIGGDTPVEILINGLPISITPTPVLISIGEDNAVQLLLLETSGAVEPDDESLWTGFEALPASNVRAVQRFASSSSSLIIPRTGMWNVTAYSAFLIEPCEGEFIGADRAVPSPRLVEFDFGGGMSFEAYLEQLTGRVPPGEYAHPATNLYTGLSEISSGPIEVTLTVVSETEMIFTMIHTQVYCRVQSIDWWQFVE